MLSEQQKKFADYYIETGNASESYKRAGYKARDNVAEVNASRLLRNAKIIDYIKERNAQLESPRIANMTEVKEFWTTLLRNKEADHKDRLKASEYIGKTNGAFLDRVEHSGEMVIIKGADMLED